MDILFELYSSWNQIFRSKGNMPRVIYTLASVL